MADVKGSRKYSSPVRDEQATRTRARILDAASELFLERGYAQTTMKDIADLAGVARDTVHAVFGNKARVLTALIDLRLVPDNSVANVTERSDAVAINIMPAMAKRNESGIASETMLEIYGDLKPGESVVSGPYKALRELKPGKKVQPETPGKAKH